MHAKKEKAIQTIKQSSNRKRKKAKEKKQK